MTGKSATTNCSAAYHEMQLFLTTLGAKKVRGGRDVYYLDGFDSEFFLRFDLERDDDQPSIYGTVDLYVVKPGESPECSDTMMRIADTLNPHGVRRVLFSLTNRDLWEKARNTMHIGGHGQIKAC